MLNGVRENRFGFLNEVRTKKDTSYIITFKINENLFWIRKGQYAVTIDQRKNINFPLYYVSNITDVEKYLYTKIVEKEFNLIDGETNKSTHIESKKNFSDYISSLKNYKKALYGISLRVSPDSEIGRDLLLTKEETIDFQNGITIIGSFDTESDLVNICEIIKNISLRYSQIRTKIKPMNKSSKKPNSINWNDYNFDSVFKIDSSNSNVERLLETDLNDEGKTDKRLIGYYSNNCNEKYIITQKQQIYKVDFDNVQIDDLISTNDIIKKIGVMQYKSEDNYLKSISTEDTEDIYIHCLHTHHFIENKRSSFELCDIFVYDKRTDSSYLIFAKYKILSSSSEVFWQSTLVSNKFASGNIKNDALKQFLIKYGMKEEYADIDVLKKSKFISLILPERGNNNTDHLLHIFNILKHSEHSSKMEIWIPKTRACSTKSGWTEIV